MNLKAVDNTLANLFEVPLTGNRQRHRQVAAADHGRTRRIRPRTSWANSPPAKATTCPSARSRWTARSRPRPRNTKSATSRSTFPCGTRRSASNASNAAICPHATIRAKVYEPAQLAGAPATFKIRRGARARMEGLAIHAASRRRRLHRLLPLRGSLPGARTRRRPNSRPSTCGRRRRCAWPSATIGISSSACRKSTGAISNAPRCASNSSCNRCLNSAAPAPAAAKRPISSC